MGKIFYLMGKSSCGKDTIYKRLLLCPNFHFHRVVMYTTRPPREGEINGSEYFFVSEYRLEEIKNAGKLVEMRAYRTIHGIWKYFTADDAQIKLSAFSYLMIGTLESYQEMKKYYGEAAVVPVYIELEDGERLTRALEREKQQAQPKYQELCRRFLADSEDFSEEKLREAGIQRRFVNGNLENCVKEIIEYLENVQFS